jgi:lipid A 3-O-deacylase
MKKSLLLLIFFAISLVVFSQEQFFSKNFFRISEDNDGINFFGKGSDWGYTNGLRLDAFHQRKNNASDFFSRLHPLAGKSSIITSGWGLIQVMITPKRTRPFIPDKNDYPYAGGLFALHTIHSANKEKKLNVLSEWVLGVMGPPSFAKETQIFLHRVIGDPRPNGWDYQLPADLLLNYNLSGEKQAYSNKIFEWIGGGQAFLGTLSDGLSLYTIFRFEKNITSFSGLSNQYFTPGKKNLAFALSLKPAVDFIFYNALLDGGLFNQNSPIRNENSEFATSLQRKKITGQLDILALISLRNFSICLTQKMFSPEFKSYSPHNVGNISVCFGW